MPEVSVIVVLWNAEPTLHRCLASLQASSVDLEVICVDNASQDRSAAIAEEAGALVLRQDRNVGFPAAVNVALEHCQGALVLLLNPDVVVQPDAIERCATALNPPRAGLVGANLLRPDGAPDPPAARRLRTLGLLALEMLPLSSLDRQYLTSAERVADRQVECINGAFMLIERTLIERIGGLDETVFLFLEDQELCRRVRELGLEVRFVAGAGAVHVAGAAMSAATSEQQANIYLHRMDSSIELIHRMQGPRARRAAVGLWVLRCGIGLCTRGAVSSHYRQRYLGGLRWLRCQRRSRAAPPPVP